MKAIIDTSVLKDFIDKNDIQNLVYNGNNIERFVLDGSVIWVAHKESSSKVILEVNKITATTYASGETYENEEFILLNIYPKTNGIVTVTYGGVSKTIDDKIGAEEPNAQQVFFGKFNNDTDKEETPASGTLTIEGDYVAWGVGTYTDSVKNNTRYCSCITRVIEWGEKTEYIPPYAFYNCTLTENKKTVILPNITSIGQYAFYKDLGDVWNEHPSVNYYFKSLAFPATLKSIGYEAMMVRYRLVENGGTTQTTYYKSIVEKIIMYAQTPPTFTYDDSPFGTSSYLIIVVPKGCGEAYKVAEGWSRYAKYIVEAS